MTLSCALRSWRRAARPSTTPSARSGSPASGALTPTRPTLRAGSRLPAPAQPRSRRDPSLQQTWPGHDLIDSWRIFLHGAPCTCMKHDTVLTVARTPAVDSSEDRVCMLPVTSTEVGFDRIRHLWSSRAGLFLQAGQQESPGRLRRRQGAVLVAPRLRVSPSTLAHTLTPVPVTSLGAVPVGSRLLASFIPCPTGRLIAGVLPA